MSVNNSKYLDEFARLLGERDDIELTSYTSIVTSHHIDLKFNDDRYLFRLDANPLMPQYYFKEKPNNEDEIRQLKYFDPSCLKHMTCNMDNIENDIEEFIEQIRVLDYTEERT